MNNAEIAIDKNIPMPERDPRAHYPLNEMEVGDSFVIDTERANAVRVRASQLGKKVSIRKLGDGTSRVWLVA